jgi:hypothetical protein
MSDEQIQSENEDVEAHNMGHPNMGHPNMGHPASIDGEVEAHNMGHPNMGHPAADEGDDDVEGHMLGGNSQLYKGGLQKP